MVRPGAERAEIAAEFELDARSPLKRWLADNDLTGDDNSCLMRRVIEAGGRSRAFINGRAATQAQLREAGEQLIDIHGQHEHQSLMRAAAFVMLLPISSIIGSSSSSSSSSSMGFHDLSSGTGKRSFLLLFLHFFCCCCCVLLMNFFIVAKLSFFSLIVLKLRL